MSRDSDASLRSEGNRAINTITVSSFEQLWVCDGGLIRDYYLSLGATRWALPDMADSVWAARPGPPTGRPHCSGHGR